MIGMIEIIDMEIGIIGAKIMDPETMGPQIITKETGIKTIRITTTTMKDKKYNQIDTNQIKLKT